jgi:hypothetical protein
VSKSIRKPEAVDESERVALGELISSMFGSRSRLLR